MIEGFTPEHILLGVIRPLRSRSVTTSTSLVRSSAKSALAGDSLFRQNRLSSPKSTVHPIAETASPVTANLGIEEEPS
jgi:hypothetical protein